jgi:hypothetical protein
LQDHQGPPFSLMHPTKHFLNLSLTKAKPRRKFQALKEGGTLDADYQPSLKHWLVPN